MGNTVNKDASRLVVNSIEHAVISNPEPVTFFSLKFLNARRTWIGFQGKDFVGDAFVDVIGKAVHLFLCRPLDLSRIAHLRLPFSLFQIISERTGWFLSSLLDGGEINQVVPEISVLDEADDYKPSLPLWQRPDSR